MRFLFGFWYIGFWFIALFVYPYFIAPFVIFAGKGSNALLNVEPITPEDFLPDARPWVGSQVRALQALGFTVVHNLRNRDSAPNVRSYFVMLQNAETRDKAMVAAFYTVNQQGITPGARYVEFSTRYTDGSAMDTNNIQTSLAFKRGENDRATRLPGVSDLALLYRVHRFLMDKYASGKAKVLPAPGEEIAALQAGARRSFEKQVEFGLMRYDAENDRFRQTLWGAFFMTYRSLFPIKQIESVRDKIRAGGLKREAQAWQPTVAA